MTNIKSYWTLGADKALMSYTLLNAWRTAHALPFITQFYFHKVNATHKGKQKVIHPRTEAILDFGDILYTANCRCQG